jgi:predicted regulator of Ras-like GTPase activity (Roadblock/LC7/MglB family)
MARGLYLPGDLVDEMERVLGRLLQKTQVTCILLADVSGQLICTAGQTSGFDPATVAALTASDMSATGELARQLGEAKPFRIHFHEGEQRHLYLTDVGGSLLLVVVFEARVPIGLVRVFTERAARELLPLIDEYETSLEQAGQLVSEGFDESLLDELDDAFGSLLD